jgi:hypothetical protein
MLTSGATPDETTRIYPGNKLVPDPDGGATLATFLPAPPERVWPWLAVPNAVTPTVPAAITTGVGSRRLTARMSRTNSRGSGHGVDIMRWNAAGTLSRQDGLRLEFANFAMDFQERLVVGPADNVWNRDRRLAQFALERQEVHVVKRPGVPQERFGSRRLGRDAFSDAVCTAPSGTRQSSRPAGPGWVSDSDRATARRAIPKQNSPARKFLFDLAIKSDFLFWAATRVAPRAMRLVMLATPPEDIAHASVEEGARATRVLEQMQSPSARVGSDC